MEKKPRYLDENLSAEARARDLVSRMTLQEKVSQMLHGAQGIERLGVPAYNWWNEALHGVARAGTATVFPQAIGLAATFDAELVGRVADVISTEGRAKFHEFQRQGDRGIYKGLTYWSPNVNIFRDPRWGRGHETYGEDPYLTGRLGVAFIRGLQGDDARYLKSAACAKHFAVHSGPEKERHEFNAVVSLKDLRETYLPAFRDCVAEGKVAGVMGAYNRTNGEPCCGNRTLLVDILRGEWGFGGYVTSDCWAIQDFNEHHKVTQCIAESAAMAVKAGCDLNCGCAYANLLKAQRDGLVAEEEISRCVERLMTIRMRLGLFDDPAHVPFASIPYEISDCDEHRALALEAAKQSLVLLKNQNNLLPLNKKDIQTVAVIGPNADSRTALYGNYNGTGSEMVTVLGGIREALSRDKRVLYAEGCHLWKTEGGDSEPGNLLSEAVSAAKHADVAVLCLGLDGILLEGEEGAIEGSSGDKADLKLPGFQQKLLELVSAVGKPVVLVLLSGSALAVTWADVHVPAIVQAFYPGAQGGRAIASLLFGEYSPAGRLPVTFYRSTEELPDFRDYSMDGRTYRFMKNDALYPFGYGLSYTKFEYSDLKLSRMSLAAGEELSVAATVKNVGAMAGTETAQLYIRDREASARVPNRQLRGIAREHFAPGEAKEITFTLTPKAMSLIDEDGNCVLEPGSFDVFVGGSQPDKRSIALTGAAPLRATFTVTGETMRPGY